MGYFNTETGIGFQDNDKADAGYHCCSRPSEDSKKGKAGSAYFSGNPQIFLSVLNEKGKTEVTVPGEKTYNSRSSYTVEPAIGVFPAAEKIEEGRVQPEDNNCGIDYQGKDELFKKGDLLNFPNLKEEVG